MRALILLTLFFALLNARAVMGVELVAALTPSATPFTVRVSLLEITIMVPLKLSPAHGLLSVTGSFSGGPLFLGLGGLSGHRGTILEPSYGVYLSVLNDSSE